MKLIRREPLVSLLQVWFIEKMLICHPIPIEGIFHEDLTKAHIRSLPQEDFKRRGDWGIFLNDLKNKLVAWHPTWLYDNEVLRYGVNNNPILLNGFCKIEGYSLIHVVQ